MIEEFISNFSGDCKDVFTRGCCYWFADILAKRFENSGAKIVYASIENHFGTQIKGKIYDVTGDVTDKYQWESWENYDDPLEKKRIIKNCIMF